MPTRNQIPAYCTQCRSRCGCLAEVEDGRLVGLSPLPGHPTGERLCPKGQASDELIYHPDRLLHPMRRTRPKGDPDPGWERISWDEALDLVAAKLKQVAAEDGPESTAFSVTTGSGTQIGDATPWIMRFINAYGSPNNVYGTEICNWHKDHATRFTFGHDIGVPDFARTDCVVLWGNNPTATWLARSVEVNKACRRGAKMLVVDPRPTSLARRADVWLAVRPGTDQALALGLARLLVERGAVDRDTAARWSNAPLLVRADSGRLLRAADLAAGGDPNQLVGLGADGMLVRYDPAARRWHGTPDLEGRLTVDTADGPVACETVFSRYRAVIDPYTPDRVAALTGIAPAQLAAAADLLAASPTVAYYTWNGVAQSVTATQTDRAMSILYALTGSYGRAGGNVPGSAAAFGDVSGGDLIPAAQKAKALGLADRPLGPPSQGWITADSFYRAVLERDPYPVRMLFSFGTNMLTSQPDPERGERALKALDFHVHADLFVNTAAAYADVLLPIATSWERDGLRTGFDVSLEGQRRVQFSRAVIDPVGEARGDIDIVFGLARRLGLGNAFFDLDIERGYEAMLGRSGITMDDLRAAPDGVDVAGAVALEPYESLDGKGNPRGFPTPSGLIEIYSERLLEIGQAPLPALDDAALLAPSDRFPLRLGCAKTLYYCHGQHRNLPTLRRGEPNPPLEIAPEDAAARGIANGDWVRIETPQGRAVAKARVTKRLAAGSVFAQHGWWVPGSADAPYGADDALAANMNQLIDTTARDPISGSVALRATACEVVRLEAASGSD